MEREREDADGFASLLRDAEDRAPEDARFFVVDAGEDAAARVLDEELRAALVVAPCFGFLGVMTSEE